MEKKKIIENNKIMEKLEKVIGINIIFLFISCNIINYKMITIFNDTSSLIYIIYFAMVLNILIISLFLGTVILKVLLKIRNTQLLGEQK